MVIGLGKVMDKVTTVHSHVRTREFNIVKTRLTLTAICDEGRAKILKGELERFLRMYLNAAMARIEQTTEDLEI